MNDLAKKSFCPERSTKPLSAESHWISFKKISILMTICLDRVGVLGPTKPQLQSHIPKLISKNLPIIHVFVEYFKKTTNLPIIMSWAKLLLAV